MKKCILALMLASCLVIAACGAEEAVETTPAATEVQEPVSEPAPEKTETDTKTEEVVAEEPEEQGIPTIGERVEKDGKIQSYLTGEWKPVEVAKRRPMAVMIPNNKNALPQYGVSLASVVVEAPMEAGTCTRLMGIFEDYDELDHIGPLRSSRLYFIFEAMSYDAIYCNWGLAVPYVAETINSDRVDNISAAVSGISKASDEAFTRDAARKAAGYATEYTGIMTIKGYTAAVARQGYATEYRDTFVQNFSIAADGEKATYDDAPSATVLKPGGDSSAPSGYGAGKPYFLYNEADGLYHRYQFDGAQIDEYNGEELTYTNVIFKIVDGAKLDDKGYLSLVMHTPDPNKPGEAYVFTNGKVIHGTWLRGVEDWQPTYYYDEDGNEIVLNQGKTWICLIWGDYADLIEYK